jgi:hypothetical protein
MLTCNTDVYSLMRGQKYLREHVFSSVERQELAVKEGRVDELTPKEQRKLKNRTQWNKGQEQIAARAAEAAEAEVEKSALGEWSATKKAVGEVEEKIAVEKTIKAFGQMEISKRQPWEDELVDRTK